MTAMKLYDNSRKEVNKSPIWFKDRFNCRFFFVENNLCYILENYDREKGATQDKTYLIQNELYVASPVMSECQFTALNDVHSKCDGYKKISIFDIKMTCMIEPF